MGGTEVNHHSQPWLVIVDKCRQCGGTLISNQHVLTAAHCGKPKSVTLGKNSCLDYEMGQMYVKVKTVTVHPQYWLEADIAGYDIAILTMEKPIEFSSTIIPACLPIVPSEDYVGHKVTLSGWGKVGDRDNKMAQINEDGTLMTINLKVLPISECQKAKWITDKISKIKASDRNINETNMICVGKFKGDPDQVWRGLHKGDSGGMVFLYLSSRIKYIKYVYTVKNILILLLL